MILNLVKKGGDGAMTNYVLLIIGCILIGIGYYHYLPLEYGGICNIVGIVTTVNAIIWDEL